VKVVFNRAKEFSSQSVQKKMKIIDFFDCLRSSSYIPLKAFTILVPPPACNDERWDLGAVVPQIPGLKLFSKLAKA